MDIDAIQEFSENQCYLNALQQQNLATKIKLKLANVSENNVLLFRQKEKLSKLLQERVGRLVFYSYLVSCNASENVVCLDSIEQYEAIPEGPFRLGLARKIIRCYLHESARAGLTTPGLKALRETVEARLERDGPITNLFAPVKEAVLLNLNLSAFPSFLFTDYYRKVLSFRLTGQKPISKNDFAFIRVLGEGGFGKVVAVSKNDTRALYACKIMSKEKIAAKKREKLIMNERDILTHIHHPFIVNLKYAFQDSESLYLILDLLSGGELGYHLAQAKTFPERDVKFYAACIVLALEYFHGKNIVYRDLKPENIMLDSDGFVRITDLGLCAFVRRGERLTQHCGTRSFMAPEQCYGDEGYTETVDWWSLGITIFYLLTGKSVFSKHNRRKFKRKYHAQVSTSRSGKDQPKSPLLSGQTPSVKEDVKTDFTQTTRRETRTLGTTGIRGAIKDDKKVETPEQRAARYDQLAKLYADTVADFPWPDSMSAEAKSICQGLITIDAKKRLGANGAAEIKAHPFFADVDWKKVEARHVPPPFVPDREYVNAKFVESAAAAFPSATKKGGSFNFPGFEYIRPRVFEEEVMDALTREDIMNS